MADQKIARGATTLGAPNTGDNVYILGGSATITGNVDWSGVAEILTFRVSSDFNGQMGSVSAPLKAKITTKLVYVASGGDMYYVADGSGADTCALMQVLGGGHLHFMTTGTATRAEVRSGELSVATACAVTALRMSGGRVNFYDDSSTDPTTVEVFGGYLYMERGATTITHTAGTTKLQAGTNNITTVNLYGPGCQFVDFGTITTLNAMGGIPNASMLSSPVTITNTNINMAIPGAQAFLDNSNVTFSNAPVRFIHDGGEAS